MEGMPVGEDVGDEGGLVREDVEMGERLFGAYRRSWMDCPGVQGMWQGVYWKFQLLVAFRGWDAFC